MKRILVVLILNFLISSCTIVLNREGIRNTMYDGIVLKTYNDKSNRFLFTFLIKTSDNKKIEEIAEWYPYSWKYATVGDSIIKEKGELYIRIKKKNGDSKIFYFDP
ncbi:MAG: hypothetical protein VB046_13975 [Paludibacter sp.]|nr:hypothetical protein [Paludibacter sp.]